MSLPFDVRAVNLKWQVNMSANQATLSARCRALLLAVAVDALLGDPPNRWHPVVALGSWMRLGERWAPPVERTAIERNPQSESASQCARRRSVELTGSAHRAESATARLAWGAAWLGGGIALVGGSAALLPQHLLLQGAVASTLLAYRGLDRAVSAVQAALEAGDLAEARRLLSWHLVSRPTAELLPDEVAAAAIESLAENFSDSLVAPALAYLLGGLPGMAIYRLVNTADAMWGYRNERYEQLGKAAARLDDALNLAPARLSAALIAGAAQLVNRRGAAAWRVARRDAGRTASPNAGWPMAAMAGALNTTLTKRGHYILGDGTRPPGTAMIALARRITRVAWLAIVVALALAATLEDT